MKKTLLFLLTLSFVLSCSDSDKDPVDPEKPKEEAPKVEIDVPEVVLPEIATGSSTSTFTSSVPWSISLSNTRSAPSWFSVTPLSGGAGKATLTIEIKEANPLYEDRNAFILIKAGTLTKNITVSQKKKEAILVSSDRIELDAESSSFNIEVKSNIQYEVVIPEEFSTWLTHNNKKMRSEGLTSSTENFKVAEGSEDGKREGFIIFKSGKLEEIVKVFQAPKSVLTLTDNQLNIDYRGSDAQEVEIRTNVNAQVLIPDSIKSWVSLIDPTSRAVRVDRIYLKIEKNTTYANRSGGLTIKDTDSDLETVLMINQAQENAIILSKKQVGVTSKGGVVEAEIQSNIEYQIKILGDAQWIKQLPTSRALKKELVRFSVEPIEGYSSRIGKVVFVNTSTKISDTLTINQAHRNALILSEKDLIISSSDTTINVELKSNVRYEVMIPDNVDWIVESKNRNLETFNHSFEIKGNLDNDSRAANIIFKDKDSSMSDTLRIYQEFGEYLKVSNPPDKIFAMGFYLDYPVASIKSNIEYEIIIPKIYDWIKIYEDSKSTPNVNDHSFVILENETKIDRTGYIIFKSKQSNLSDTITVSQKRHQEITADKKNYTLSGEERILEVKLDTDINVSSPLQIKYSYDTEDEIDWITEIVELDQLHRRTYKFALKENTTNIARKCMIRFVHSESETYGYAYIEQMPRMKAGEYYFSESSSLENILESMGVDGDTITTMTIKGKTYPYILSPISRLPKLEYIDMSDCEIIDNNLNYPFQKGDHIKTIILPKSLEYIGEHTFAHQTRLEHIKLPNGLKGIGNYAFSNCYKLKGTLGLDNELLLPESLEFVGNKAFEFSDRLKTLTIEGPTKLGDSAFTRTGIENVVFHDDAKLGEGIFYQSQLLGILKLPENLEIIPERTFGNSEGITEIVFGDKVKEIHNSAFGGCFSLRELNLPETIEILGSSAFSGCENLSGTIILPKALKEIGNWAFEKSNYSAVTFPEGLEVITGFNYSYNLIEVNLPSTAKIINNMAFASCKKLETITLPKELKVIAFGAFSNSGLKGHITLPEGLEELSGFADCKEITSINFPNSLKKIGGLQNTSLSGELNLPPHLEEIDKEAFSGLTRLTGHLRIPKNVKIISEKSFSGCTGITSLELQEGLEMISEKGFYGCSGITGELVLPKGLDSVGKEAFYNCANIIGMIDIPEYTYIGGSAFIGTDISAIKVKWKVPSSMPSEEWLGHRYTYPFIADNVDVHIPTGSKDIYDRIWGGYNYFEY